MPKDMSTIKHLAQKVPDRKICKIVPQVDRVFIRLEELPELEYQKVECIHGRSSFAFNKTGTTTEHKRHQEKCAMRKKTVQVGDNQTKLTFASDGSFLFFPHYIIGRVDMEVVKS
nr:zinc finger BED domain-containing protein RICESLEEPER 2-like [Ipomoea batatas]